ncbi:MAG: DUF559 domain-containing protein [Coleofasciculaceae cyanobacterium SM2_1_6]|nr:DUF559 domain-containing protein [Coleofasciculaceae cyanobacterium SM2_1_6]
MEGLETQAWEITPELHRKMVEIARQFRKQPTPSEKILWQELRGRKLDNHKFRRQQPIGIFVVDFFCAAERLIVEVDGGIHESQQELDRQRQELLESLGLRFIRVSSDRVENNLSSVLEEIRQAILNPMNPRHPLTPSPTRGEGGHDSIKGKEEQEGHENLAPLYRSGRGAGGEGFYGTTDPEERAAIRAELDGIVAHLYGLSEIEFSHILSTFPLVPEETKTAALQAYQNLGKPVTTSEIATLIKQGENNLVEFKSTARWNLRENKADKTMEQVILKSVAAFLNTNGGTLLIGVEDDGNILGLAADYQTLKKKDSDGLLLFLSNDLLLKEFGKEHANLFDIKVEKINNLEVCRINIKPASQPMYVNITNKSGTTEECFFIRGTNSALNLKTREAVEYIKTHF